MQGLACMSELAKSLYQKNDIKVEKYDHNAALDHQEVSMSNEQEEPKTNVPTPKIKLLTEKKITH